MNEEIEIYNSILLLAQSLIEGIEKISIGVEEFKKKKELFESLKQEQNKYEDEKKQIEIQITTYRTQSTNHGKNEIDKENIKKEKDVCFKKFGHEGFHTCDLPGHKCKDKCIKKNCYNTCHLLLEHDGEHTCESSHGCKNTCAACRNKYKYFLYDEHLELLCNEIKCKFKCELCASECSFEDHFHHLNTTYKNHICGKEHNCVKKCEKEGICQIMFTEISKTYNCLSGEIINYIYLRPDVSKEVCHKTIPSEKMTHDDEHICEKIHRCDNTCPDCKSFCSLIYNHTGLHEFTHRNKENCIFTNIEGNTIEINDETGIRKYQVKDEAVAKNCFNSCKRR
ncbi:unnamed protein product, partial [Brachionus calyciflorus]